MMRRGPANHGTNAADAFLNDFKERLMAERARDLAKYGEFDAGLIRPDTPELKKAYLRGEADIPADDVDMYESEYGRWPNEVRNLDYTPGELPEEDLSYYSTENVQRRVNGPSFSDDEYDYYAGDTFS